MDEQEHGVSLGEIFHVIFSQKWLVLIITTIITVVGTLAIIFGYNPIKTDYVSSFTVNFAGASNGKYPDNRNFDYREIISPSNLEAVKASNSEEFGSIDVKKLSENISITREDNGSSSTVQPLDYVIKASKKCFKNADQAEDFLTTLANYPVAYVNSWATGLNHSANLSNYESATDYESRIEFLKLQAEYLTDCYKNLSESTELSVDPALLGTASAALQQVGNEIRYAEGELSTNKYIMNIDTLKNYSEEFVTLNRELSVNLGVWKMLYPNIKPGDASADFTSEVLELAYEIESAQQKIADIIDYFWQNEYRDCLKCEGDNLYDGVTYTDVVKIDLPQGSYTEPQVSRDFGARLDGIKDSLNALTDEYGTAFASLQSKAAFVSYNGAQMTTEGGMNTIVAIALSLIIGLIIACVAVLIKGMPSYLKNKRGETEPAAEATEQK